MKSSLLLIEAAAASTIAPTLLTFYGYPDNDPPSADIAYDCGRGYTANGISPIPLSLCHIYSIDWLADRNWITLQSSDSSQCPRGIRPVWDSLHPISPEVCDNRGYMCEMQYVCPSPLSLWIYAKKKPPTGKPSNITWTSGLDQQSTTTMWFRARIH